MCVCLGLIIRIGRSDSENGKISDTLELETEK